MAYAPLGLRHAHDLSRLGLTVQADGKDQYDESHRALGYEGQGSVKRK
jgi:hypothetical protein